MAPIQQAAWNRKTFEFGTWGSEIRPELKPGPADVVVAEHWCSSGFANTDLDLQLKKHGIHKLIVTGLIAHTCVEATVVSGHQKSSFFRLLPEASNIIAPKAQSSVRSSRWRIVARVAGTQTSPIDGLRPRRCLNPDCSAMFALCRSCDRGQRYCSDPCRKRMLRRQLLAAGHRYQASEAGKEAHRHRQSHLSATEIPGGCDASGSGFDHHLATDSLGVLDSMRHLRASQPLDEPVLLATG